MPRAAMFDGHGRPFRLVEAPAPEPRGGEILVGVACCALCRSDLHTHAGRRHGPTPCVLGHEIVGRILALGDTASKSDFAGRSLSVGDRVTWSVAASCGTCFFCERELPQKCERLFKYGHAVATEAQPFVGGLGEVILLREGTAVVKLADSLTDELASTANCAVATVAACLRRGAPKGVGGARVLVLGAGVLGLTACAMAADEGATVTACDIEAGRARGAIAFGATEGVTPDTLEIGKGFDFVLELAGAAASVTLALGSARTGGTVVLAGTVLPTPAVPLDPEAVVRRMLTITGVHNYAPRDLVRGVDFLAASGGKWPFATWFGAEYELGDVDEAFAEAARRPGRVIVRPVTSTPSPPPPPSA